MVFNRKDAFFLDLGSEGAKPAKVAIKEPAAKPVAESAAKQGSSSPLTLGLPAVGSPALGSPAVAPGLAQGEVAAAATSTASTTTTATTTATTAEAIAAELRAAQEALPPKINVTFAPDCLNPANAVASRRRTAGANLGDFKAMAKGLFKP